MWHERMPASVSHFTPGTLRRTARSVDPTPTPRAVRSPGPVRSIDDTREPPWKVTRIPPR